MLEGHFKSLNHILPTSLLENSLLLPKRNENIFSIVVLIAALMVVNAKPFDISAELSNLQYSLSEKVKIAEKGDKTKTTMAKIIHSNFIQIFCSIFYCTQ